MTFHIEDINDDYDIPQSPTILDASGKDGKVVVHEVIDKAFKKYQKQKDTLNAFIKRQTQKFEEKERMMLKRKIEELNRIQKLKLSPGKASEKLSLIMEPTT